MQPGKELDKLIAEKVMGWSDLYGDGSYLVPAQGDKEQYMLREGFNPSTNIEDAWKVVEKLDLLGGDRRLIKRRGVYEITDISQQGHGYRECIGSGKTAPHAICLAALRAIGHK